MLSQAQKDFFAENGYLLLPQRLSPDALDACARRVDEILDGRWKVHFFARYGAAGGKPVFYRIPQLAPKDEHFGALARNAGLLEAVRELVGPADVFRDILVGKPPREGHSVVYHQDAAYWDLADPSRVVSAWIALDDAPPEAGCLQFIAGSHRAPVRHDIFYKGLRLPRWLSRSLRGAVSLTGTGDNPQTATEKVFARLKDAVLGRASKLLPSINDLNWLRADPRAVPGREVVVPAKKGDALLFHGLLLHASGPNSSPRPRRAYIVTYAGA